MLVDFRVSTALLTGCQPFTIHYRFENQGNAPAEPPPNGSVGMPVLKVRLGVGVYFAAKAAWPYVLAPGEFYEKDEAVTWPTSDPDDDPSERIQGIDPGAYGCNYAYEGFTVVMGTAGVTAAADFSANGIGLFTIDVVPACQIPPELNPPDRTFGWCPTVFDCPEAPECVSKQP